MNKPRAPFKRGQRLLYKNRHEVKYVKWHGPVLVGFIVIEFPDKSRHTTCIENVKPIST